jgi:hypothetical protein
MQEKHELAKELNPKILQARIPDKFIQRLKDVQIAPKILFFIERINQYGPLISIPFPEKPLEKSGPLYDLRNDADLIKNLKHLIFCLPTERKFGVVTQYEAMQGSTLKALNTLNATIVLISLLDTFKDEALESFLKEGVLYDAKIGNQKKSLTEKESKKKGSKKSQEKQYPKESLITKFVNNLNKQNKQFIPNLYKTNQIFKDIISDYSKELATSIKTNNQGKQTKDINLNHLLTEIIRRLLTNKDSDTYPVSNMPLEYQDGTERHIASHDKEVDAFPEGTITHYQNEIKNYQYAEIEPLLNLIKLIILKFKVYILKNGRK